MSENSLSETCGMVYFIRPDDTPEYLEELRKRGFITVSINIDEAVEKEYANVVVTGVPIDVTGKTWKEVFGTEIKVNSEIVHGPANYIMLADPEKQSSNIMIAGTPIDISGKTTKEIMEILGLDINGKGVTWEGPTYSVNSETKDRINGEDIVVTIIDPETDLGEGGKGVTWEGPTYSVNWPESVDTTPQEYKLVLVEGEPGEPLKLVPVVDETDTTVSQAPADNDTVRNIEPGLYGPGNVTVHIDPEYAKQMEEQFKNVKMRVGGYGRGQAFFRFIYDSEEAETPSGYELVRTEMWSGPDCTDEQIADIARYIISNDISDEQQKALMLEAVDAFLAKEEKITVADGTPNYTPVTVYSQIVSPDEKEAKAEDTSNAESNPGTLIADTPVEWTTPVFDEEGNLVMSLVQYTTDPSSKPVAYRWVSVDEEQTDPLALALPRHEMVPLELSDLNENELALLKIVRGEVDLKVQETFTDTTTDPNKRYDVIAVNTTNVVFVSTVDQETGTVTSVDVSATTNVPHATGWHTIGTLNNPDGIDWKYQTGNLTGSGAPSVVWHAQELGALGVWTDGTDNWTGIAGWFDANWAMLGCGDFDGDGKDSVLMSLNGGLFYSVDLDGTLTSLGDLNWSGWEFGAIGDFAGDGKDDVVLFNKGLNCVVLLADGNADAWTSLGMIDSSDWAVAGAGDFNNDGIDDLLVRQDSTGLIGGYAGADMSRWSVVGSAYADTTLLA